MPIVRPKDAESIEREASRSARNIVLMIDAALGHLHDIGYDRGWDAVEIDPRDGLPAVVVAGQPVFEVVLNVNPEKGISIDGEWTTNLPKRRFLWARRIWRAISGVFRRKRK